MKNSKFILLKTIKKIKILFKIKRSEFYKTLSVNFSVDSFTCRCKTNQAVYKIQKYVSRQFLRAIDCLYYNAFLTRRKVHVHSFCTLNK